MYNGGIPRVYIGCITGGIPRVCNRGITGCITGGIPRVCIGWYMPG